ncbi:MAG: pyruvate, water dikinase regulatory protein [Bacillota bacterium]
MKWGDWVTREMTVYVVSDSIGETAESVARAAISQFEMNSEQVRVERIPFVHSHERVDEALERVDRDEKTLIVYTLVVSEVREYIEERCSQEGIPTVDIMGPLMRVLCSVLGRGPRQEPGIIHRMDDRYFRRVAAVEFAVRYDDGREPRGFLKADVILTGVSRTSKTPVCMYLAHREYRAANYPLAPEVEPARELFLVRDRVIGMTIAAEQLQVIRRERMRRLGLTRPSNYDDLGRIRQELRYAASLFRELDCPVIDVTNKAVEETATTVLEIMRKGEWRGGGRADG